MARYFEDYQVGYKVVSPGRTVTEADISIILGIGRYNAPIMIDEEFAKATRFGGRVAPGMVTLLIAGGLENIPGILDSETVIAFTSLNNVRFRNPLRAGDTLRVETEITDKKETSKPDVGLIIHKQVCTNQKGETIIEYEETHLVRRKPI